MSQDGEWIWVQVYCHQHIVLQVKQGKSHGKN